jgi:hypothetical protein
MKKIVLCILGLACFHARALEREEKDPEVRISFKDALAIPQDIAPVEPFIEPEHDYAQLLAENPIKFQARLRRMVLPAIPQQPTRARHKTKQELEEEQLIQLQESIATLAAVNKRLKVHRAELDHAATIPWNRERKRSLGIACAWTVFTGGIIGTQAWLLHQNFSMETKIATAIPLVPTGMEAVKASLKNISEVVHNTPIDKELENNATKVKATYQLKKELQAKVRGLKVKDADQDVHIQGLEDRVSALETRIAIDRIAE